ncbi:MAG: class I SAM-dependent methyltransferase [Planctomycetes bacterium]|nr:class I SAM-dependent methyltransferase [Planctomycetota bacterium]
MSASDREFTQFVHKAQELQWCDPAVRRRLNQAGLHVLPANFYSTVPTVDEVEESFEYAGDRLPYLTDALFDRAAMGAFLDSLMPFSAEFEPPAEGEPDHGTEYFWGSPNFGHSDAMAYYCVIRLLKPKRIVEVGAGHSTLVAIQALRRNGVGRVVCVEPFPRPFLRTLGGLGEIDLVEEPVQTLQPSWFDEQLGDGDVLFIDSTHTVKAGSDCLHLYLRVLPALRRRLMIHAHDIFLPEAYPQEWAKKLHIYWTEQYLLMALLLGNDEYTVKFGSNYHRLCSPQQLEQLMAGKALAGGGSFWFTKQPR